MTTVRAQDADRRTDVWEDVMAERQLGADTGFVPRSLGEIAGSAGLTALNVTLLSGLPGPAVSSRWDDEGWLDGTHGQVLRELVRVVPGVDRYVEARAAARLVAWADDLRRCCVELTGSEAATPEALRTVCRTRLGADHVERALRCLRPRERKAITLWLGLGGAEPATYDAVGAALGLSRERIRQVVVTSKRKLAAAARSGVIEARVLDAMIGSRQRPRGPSFR